MAKVVVLGASPNSERYSYQAVSRLLAAGHAVIPINPRGGLQQGLPVLKCLKEVEGRVDTLTVYVGPDRLVEMVDEILQMKPHRVIFNPGAESSAVAKILESVGIEVVEGCTLVMLAAGTF
jgi:predicted CoA-binding protein